MRASLRRVMRILVERSLEPGIPWRVFPQPARSLDRPAAFYRRHRARQRGSANAIVAPAASKGPAGRRAFQQEPARLVRLLLLREAREQSLLLIFEDLHWVDGETQALLDGLVETLG